MEIGCPGVNLTIIQVCQQIFSTQVTIEMMLMCSFSEIRVCYFTHLWWPGEEIDQCSQLSSAMMV